MPINTLKAMNLVYHQFEDLELWYPVLRLREEGVQVHLIGERSTEQYIGKYGIPAISDYGFTDIDPDDYQALLIPGGWAPDKLRRFPEVIDIVKKMNEQKKPVGIICHAGWVLISADILRGKRATSTPGIMDDMKNAGAIWLDEPVVVDDNIISSRRPPDLPLYMKSFIEELKKRFS